MNTQNAILWIHTQTPTHSGSGTAMGVVDLPIQRERHTAWPVIPGSSIKGILRDLARRQIVKDKQADTPADANKNDLVSAVFGHAESEYAGSISITDARLLAFPVRSAAGVFAYVTCPMALSRLKSDLAIVGKPTQLQVPSIAPGQCACPKGSSLLIKDATSTTIILEEFDFTPTTSDLTPWAAELAKYATPNPDAASRIQQHLVLVDDDHFTHFVKNATQVEARTALEYQTKTVRDGALFYEEFLPAESILYTLLLCADARDKNSRRTASDNQQYIKQLIQSRPVIQIGAGETTGRGLCAVTLA